MSGEPEFRKKHQANDKKRDKGMIFASQKHVRIQLENQWRHEKKQKFLKQPEKWSWVFKRHLVRKCVLKSLTYK